MPSCPHCQSVLTAAEQNETECPSCGRSLDESLDSTKPPVSGRVVGLCFFLGGLALLGFFLGWPLLAARVGAEQITIYGKLVMLGGVCMFFGVTGIIVGDRAEKFMPGPDDDVNWFVILYLVVMVGAFMGGWWWLDGYLDSLGYVDVE